MTILRISQFWIFFCFCTWLSLSPAPPDVLLSYSDKLLHAVGYCALFLSARLAYPAPPFLARTLIGLFGYSILIEILQHFIPHRGFSWFDILANAGGLLLGLAITSILLRCIK